VLLDCCFPPFCQIHCIYINCTAYLLHIYICTRKWTWSLHLFSQNSLSSYSWSVSWILCCCWNYANQLEKFQNPGPYLMHKNCMLAKIIPVEGPLILCWLMHFNIAVSSGL
jgi:hypothetical protein